MILQKYTHGPADSWVWRRANLADAAAIGSMAFDQYRDEIDNIFTPSGERVAYYVARDILDQTHNLKACYVAVACDKTTGAIIAYTWAFRDFAIWSADEMLNIKLAHTHHELAARDKVKLCAQMIQQWEAFCFFAGIPVICSTTMRHTQDAFLRLHEQAGYSVRGSCAYKRVILLP